MASNHDDCAEHHHRCALTLIVDKRTEEGSEYHREDGEPLEQTCGFGVGNLQRLLEEVGCKTLEGEDSGIVEHAKERYNPEHLRLEDLSEVGDMELILRIFGVGSFAKGNELFVELMVHDAEDKVVEQADYEQQTGEEERSRN